VASVEAAWEWALAREERRGDVVGFYHTHPPGAGAQLSSRDICTMRAWCSALGKPLLCLIAAGKVLNGYVFANANGQGVQVEIILKGEQGWYSVQA
jgi:proteasome lid subunit RPN8/RPN11